MPQATDPLIHCYLRAAAFDKRPEEDGWLVGLRGAVRGALARIAGNGGRLSELDSAISAIKKVSDQVSKMRRSQKYQIRYCYCKIGGDS